MHHQMKCRDCTSAITGKDKGDHEMARMGYKTCALARTAVERATYIRGSQECLWPERLK